MPTICANIGFVEVVSVSTEMRRAVLSRVISAVSESTSWMVWYCFLLRSVFLGKSRCSCVNSSSLKRSASVELSGSPTLRSETLKWIGAWVFSSTSCLLNIAWSLNWMRLSCCFFFVMMSTCSYRRSIFPNVWIRERAVLGPIPGTPGTLSAVSPDNPITSIIWEGVIPVATISCRPTMVSFMGSHTIARSEMSCFKSLSPVTTTM